MIRSEILQNIRPLQVRSPLDRYTRLMGVQNAQLQNRSAELGVQQQEQQLADRATNQQRVTEQGLQIYKIFEETQGDIDKALPRILQIPGLDPKLVESYQGLVKGKADIRNIDSQITDRELTRIETNRRNLATEAQQKTDAERAASKPVEVQPGNALVNPVDGKSIYTAPPKPPDLSWQEQTYEDWLKSPESAKHPKNRVGFERWQNAMQGQNRVDPAVTVQTVDKDGKPVTRVLPRSQAIGQEFPIAPTAQERNFTSSLEKINPVLSAISELSELINTQQGVIAKISGGAERVKAKANLNDDVAEYEALISGFTPMVARAVGHTGVLTQQDVDSVRALFPRPGDSKSLRDRKIARVKSILGEVTAPPQKTETGRIKVQIPGQAPGEIDADQWDAFKAKYPNAVKVTP
jgi:hypothetical protein